MKINCARCGKLLTTDKYNPYNVTFGNYYFKEFSNNKGYFCRKCAEWFVDDRNQCKGGHWIIEKLTKAEALSREHL